MDVRIPLIAGIMIFMVLIFVYVGGDFGFSATSAKDYIAIIPSMIFIIGGLYIVVKIGGMYSFPALSMMGIGLAILLKSMYDNGYITVQMMSGLTIAQIQFWCVIIAGLAGAIVAATTAKK